MKEAEGYKEDVVPKARGEAAQMVQQAEGYKAQRVIRAQGDAERFLKILAEYDKAKAITRDRLYLESVERIMSTTARAEGSHAIRRGKKAALSSRAAQHLDWASVRECHQSRDPSAGHSFQPGG